MNLDRFGWNEFHRNGFEPYKECCTPGRVVAERYHSYTIQCESAVFTASVSGAFRYRAAVKSDYPTAGDWVAVRNEGDACIIEAVLPRKSFFSRKAAGNETEEQIVAANIDYIFLVFGLEGSRGFTQGGLERYISRAWDSGAVPVVVLNKIDICPDKESFLSSAEYCAAGADVIGISALTGEGVETLDKYLRPGNTVTLTGPSGAGKSAIINRLSGTAERETGRLREGDKKGRHTTTTKDLVMLPSGAMLIDSPGMRELQLWGDTDSLSASFPDIAELAESCRFRDCAHSGEPGCAVQQAVSSGELDIRRYENYLQLRKELEYVSLRKAENAEAVRREKGKKLSLMVKEVKKYGKR